jgi:glycosyltransferase involved in cell wall biosynthesis
MSGKESFTMSLSKKDISFIQPSRNNLKYLKWSYEGIRKNAGPEPTICVADDFSNDGTWEWCEEMMSKDPNFKALRNEGPTRLGHTILYDRLINELATTPIVGIYHADMWLCPGALESVLKHIKPLTVVSLTRIEPDLHPAGPEKVLIEGAPTEPEHFDESWFNDFFNNYLPTVKGKTTEGIFAPWFLFKEDFTSIGGHDPLYAPQSKEDSDIFNRFLLNDYQFIQTWEGCVFHLTCRGSRFNPTLTTPGQNSNEWEAQNIRSTRNFIRKWGHFVKHDKFMKPVVPHKYDVEFEVSNCDLKMIEALEPWCDRMTLDCSQELINQYIESEQPNTKFDLSKKFNMNEKSDIIVEFDALRMTNQSYQFIQQLSEIFDFNQFDSGQYEFDIFKVKVNKVKHYENNLIRL